MPDFDMPGSAASFEERGGWLVRRLVAEFGLTLEQAAGLVGNLGFESNGFKTLQEIAPLAGGRGGYGWAQWTGPRRVAFEKWATAHHLPLSSDEANSGYLIDELHNSQADTIIQLKKQKTIDNAVFSVGQTFERPGGTTPTHLPGYSDRLAWAKRALAGAAPVTAPLARAQAIEVLRGCQRLFIGAGVYTDKEGGDGKFGKDSKAALNTVLTAAGQPGI